MRALGSLYPDSSFNAGTFAWLTSTTSHMSSLSSPARPSLGTTWSAAVSGERHARGISPIGSTRARTCVSTRKRIRSYDRHFFVRLHASSTDEDDVRGGENDGEKRDRDDANETPEGEGPPRSQEGTAAATPRADEQVGVDGGGEGDGSEGQDAIDWDKAWASTRQNMEKKKETERKEAAPFSGRKQIVATKNDQGGYDFEEISANGSSRMKGDKGSGGFGFADGGQGNTSGGGGIRDQEQEAVNLATTNKAFAGLAVLLVAALVFEIYVYLTGGITNGATRFQGMGQPTTYDALPLPATPDPEDDLSV